MKHERQGEVKFFNTEKGFGFIKDASTGKDIFVHKSGLNDSIKENDIVNFNVIEGKKGENAVDVIVI